MATRRFGLSPGGSVDPLVLEAAGAAVSSDYVEVTVELAETLEGSTRGIRKSEVMDIMDRIKEAMMQSAFLLE